MKLPRARRARVDEGKVVGYLLSTDHPDGRSKAAFFGAFRFSAARWELLADALRDHGMNGEVTSIATSDYGTRYSVDGVIETPDGRTLECEPSGSSTRTGCCASSPRIRRGGGMPEEHDRIVLTDDADPGLKAGDVGTIVHVHRGGEAFEVEFLTLDGHTAALATVSSSQVRPVTGADITHARDFRAGAAARPSMAR